MTPEASAWLWLQLRPKLIRLFPERLWQRLFHAVQNEQATRNPNIGVQKTWEQEHVPWDVAADTGEFTHIVKSGADITLAMTLAKEPPP